MRATVLCSRTLRTSVTGTAERRRYDTRGHPLSTYADFPVFWTPSPPCSHFGLNHKTKFTQPRLLRTLFGPLPPSPSLRTYFMDGPLSKVATATICGKCRGHYFYKQEQGEISPNQIQGIILDSGEWTKWNQSQCSI